MKTFFIGGTGIISSAITELLSQKGEELIEAMDNALTAVKAGNKK